MDREAGNVLRKMLLTSDVILFVSLFITFAYFFHRESGWNVDSRIRLTYTIVEQHSFAIDKYVESEPRDVGDKAFFNGHYYSDKIIGTSLLGVIPMAISHFVSRAFDCEFSEHTKRYVVTTFSVGILGALAGVILYRLLLLFGTSPAGSLFLTLAFVFGTQTFGVCTVFLSYAPALFFEMLSYFILVRFRDSLTGRRLFLSGLALGASLLCEYTVGIVAVGLTIYAFAHTKVKRTMLLFCLGVIIPLLPFVVYTMICFGRLMIPYDYLVRGEFKEGMSRGFQGITGFNPAALYFITVHRYRGLFYHSPFLAL
ncbi:hypothetical protein FJY63_09715, partial [Candidatus Sumerlaeota bacterium]|nr:hypothetical protein [Candidatus Sumerlaeota bacterium]